ncbi:MAG: STAS domain-containing protein [Flavobacteriales bacterium]|nr:STAS domain-containing protein [Flavobacteriales bacterium]MBP6698288.1 STAS domain-containing protein [Flavobacteriales bacterium]
MWNPEFIPKSFTVLAKGYSREHFGRDLIAGVIVGIVALPLAIAFAIASGVSPEKGLITAVIAGFVISAFGGSRVQIGGPTGAFIVIVYAIVQKHGVGGLTIATFMAGFIILLMGLLRFGALLKYFPHTLIVGFTSGIAVIIFSAQVNDLFGLRLENVPAGFLDKWSTYFSAARSIDPQAVAIATGTVLICVLLPRITKRVPGSLIAIVAATAAVHWLGSSVETIGSRFGEIPRTFPLPHVPDVDMTTIKDLLQPALAIALLGSIESLLSAVVADGSIGGRHRSNMELIAQGGANILSGMFGGIPATGAIARTATNVKNGGRTPVAGMVHAITLLVIMIVAAPLAEHIPMACLAGILVVVAWNMSEAHAFVTVFRTNRYDRVVLLTTFLLTVVFDLVIAIEIGMVLAAFLFMKRMSDAVQLSPMMTSAGGDVTFESELGEVPKDVLIYEISGPLFFGAAQTFTDTLKTIGDKHRTLILLMRNVPLIDATGLHRLKDIVRTMERRGIRVLFAGVNAPVASDLRDAGIVTDAALYPDVREALASSSRDRT